MILVSQASGSAQDWPQWRGPNRDGIVQGFASRAEWPQSLRPRWKVTVGAGHSSPVVVGARVYLHSRQGEREVVSALDLGTGKILWQDSHEVRYQVNPAAASHGAGPKSTPVVALGNVYTFGISGTLSCLDAQTGKVRWRKSFAGEFPETAAFFGSAMSPLVDGDIVIAHVGGPGKGAIRAFDASTGNLRWSWDGDVPAYASPVVLTAGGIRQIVTQTSRFVVGLSLASGDLLWSVPFTTQYDQNSVTPLVYKDALVVSGLARGIQLLRPVKRGTQWGVESVWERDEPSMYMSSPVLMGDLMFAFSHRNRGQIVCLDPATGTTLWATEGRQGENMSLVAAGDLVFALTTDAQLIVFRKNPAAFDPVRRYDVAGSPTWAHPVVLTGGILIKDESTLAFWSF
jgi:outer membrane protein assembly factor BamB